MCDCPPLSSYNNNAVNASCQSNLRRRRDIKCLLSKEIPFYFVLIISFLSLSPHILLNNLFMAWKEPFLYFPFFLLQVSCNGVKGIHIYIFYYSKPELLNSKLKRFHLCKYCLMGQNEQHPEVQQLNIAKQWQSGPRHCLLKTNIKIY